MSVNGSAWRQAAIQQRAELAQARQYTYGLVSRHQQRRQEVAQQANVALAELCATLLPNLEAASIARAAEVAGYPNLISSDLPGQMAAERTQLVSHIAAIEASPTYQKREFLLDPKSGRLPVERAELEETRRPLRDVIDRCANPRMGELVTNGYGTPDYAVPFWRLSYYQDWEAGDQILEGFPGKTFAEVRHEFLEAGRADRALGDRLRELDGLIDAGNRLLQDHAASRAKLLSIVDRHLAAARGQLGRLIMEAGGATMGPHLSTQPDLDVLGKRLFGLAAKLTYLDQIEAAQLAPVIAELDAGIAKADQEIVKFSRPKKASMYFDDAAYQRRFRPRGPRYQKAWQRYQRSSDSVYVFDRYDRGSWAEDFLWWDLMTNGRVDGDFIREVHTHRLHHPNYVYTKNQFANEPDSPPDLAPEPLEHDGAFDPS